MAVSSTANTKTQEPYMVISNNDNSTNNNQEPYVVIPKHENITSTNQVPPKSNTAPSNNSISAIKAYPMKSLTYPRDAGKTGIFDCLKNIDTIVKTVWGDFPIRPTMADDKRKPWLSSQLLLEVWSVLRFCTAGPIEWPIAKGEEFVALDVKEELLDQYGKRLSTTTSVVQKALFALEIPMKWKRSISKAHEEGCTLLVTETSAKGVKDVIAQSGLKVTLKVLSATWLDWFGIPMTNQEALALLAHLHMPLEGNAMVLDGRPWVFKDEAIWLGERRVRPMFYMAGASYPVTAATSVVVAVVANSHFLGDHDRTNGRWFAQLDRSIQKCVNWDSEAQAGPVEPDRDWFLANTFKAKDVSSALPFNVKGGFALFIRPEQAMPIINTPANNGEVAVAAYPHNLVHLHKGGFDQLLRADQLMVKMSWYPLEEAIELAKEILSYVYGTTDVQAHVKAMKGLAELQENVDASNVYEVAARNLVYLLSTKEAKITKRIALAYPNTCPVLGLEEANVCHIGSSPKAYLKPSQTKGGEGVEVRACFTPYFQLPAGVAAEVKPVSVVTADYTSLRAQFVIERRLEVEVLVDPDFAIKNDDSYTWSRPVYVRKGELLLQVPFKTESGVKYIPVKSTVTAELVSITVVKTLVGDTTQASIEVVLKKVERESKLRSNEVKAMTVALPNGPEMPVFCSLNATTEAGAIDAHYIFPADADKSEGLAEWKLNTIAQTAVQRDVTGKLLYPRLNALFLAAQDEDGCVSPLAFATGRIRGLFEEFDRLFGQDIWMDYVDTRLSETTDSNFIQTTKDLLVAQFAESAFTGVVTEDISFLAGISADAAAFIGDLPVTIVAVGPYANTYTSVYCFYVDASGRSRMLVRTYAFVGREQAPLVTVVKVESASVAKSGSNARMGLMAGTAAGVSVAGDKEFAMALMADSRKAGNEAVALYAMSRGASLRAVDAGDERYMDVIEVDEKTFDAEAIEKAFEEGNVLETLAQSYPETVFKFSVDGKVFTVWFPLMAKFGGRLFETEEGMATSLVMAIYRLALGQSMNAPAVVSRLRRVRAQLIGVTKSKGTLGSLLYGRISAQCKTVATLGVPSGRMLVRYCAKTEDCYDTSMFFELTRCQLEAGGGGFIDDQKFIMWRPPLTAPCVLSVMVVRPGDELWGLVENRPHVVVTNFWAPYIDRGDCDGDGRSFTPAFDSKLPITTYADLMKDLEASTGRTLGKMETYIGDHMMPKSRGVVLPMGTSKKSLKTDQWVKDAMVASTLFVRNFNLGHELLFMTTVIVELLLNDQAMSDKPKWLNSQMISATAEIYETFLGGYDAGMVPIAEWIKDSETHLKGDPKTRGPVVALRNNQGVVTDGHFAKAGLNPHFIEQVEDLAIMTGEGQYWCRNWKKTLTSSYPCSKSSSFTDADVLDVVRRATAIAKLLHSLSKGTCPTPLIESQGKGVRVPLWYTVDAQDEYGFSAMCPESTEYQDIDDVLSVAVSFREEPSTEYEWACTEAIATMGKPTPALRFISRFLPTGFQSLVNIVHLDTTVGEDKTSLRAERPEELEHLCANSVFGRIFFNYLQTAFVPLMLNNLQYYDVEIDAFRIDPKKTENNDVVTTTAVASFPYYEEDAYKQLDDKQKEAVEAILNAADPSEPDSNVFLTGGPGRGKSHTLMLALKYVGYIFGNDVNVVLTGSSGTSAVNISTRELPARTINSAFRLGASGTTLPSGMRDQTAQNRRGRKTTASVAAGLKDRLKAGKVVLVVIDEVSMATSETIYLVKETINLAHRGKSVRFIFVGDFAQLGVIDKPSVHNPGFNSYPWLDPKFQELGGRTLSRAGIFDNRTVLCELTQPHRTTDKQFVSHMDRIGLGDVPVDTAEYLNKFLVSAERPMPEDALHIFPGNKDVARVNDACAAKAREEGKRFFTSVALVNGQKANSEALKGEFWLRQMEPMALEQSFFIGAPIQFRLNDLDNNLFANGSTGVIVDFDEAKNAIVVRLDKDQRVITVGRRQMLLEPDEFGKEPPTVFQIPAVLAAAMTGHKVQGQTLDKAVVIHVPYDLSKSKMNAAGWMYVAMTRVRNPKEQLFINSNLANVIGSIKAGGEYRALWTAFLDMLRAR